MPITLNRLVARGLGQTDVELPFHPSRTLVRGPSDTGKSYIRDCLWYLLGGDKRPKRIPEDAGYETISLEFSAQGAQYEVERSLVGGGIALYQYSETELGEKTLLERELPDLLVELAGASGKQILRARSKRGAVTGGDLRHWFLLSQPRMISEDATSGVDAKQYQRIGSFHLFLTGSDDSSVVLTKTKTEKDRITGQLSSAQEALRRALSGLPPELTRAEVVDALERVDETLTEINRQYDARAASLKELRTEVSDVSKELRAAVATKEHSEAMVTRFELLDDKYLSDLDRLGAIDEAAAFFKAIPNQPCPVCGTLVERQPNPTLLKRISQEKLRSAVVAEAGKIRSLRSGLVAALDRERLRFEHVASRAGQLTESLRELERQESRLLSSVRLEFAADPKTLAFRRSELTAQLNLFDEVERLTAEIDRLKKLKVSRGAPVVRDAAQHGLDVATYAKALLIDWGFSDIESARLDVEECDLLINERRRLDYGAGKRSVFLAAFAIALLKHGMLEGHPSIGFLVIDSPLKAYADPESSEDRDVPISTLKDRFYEWLSKWNGPGQIIILENEKVEPKTANVLKPIEFTKRNDIGRAGFYLRTLDPIQSATDGEL